MPDASRPIDPGVDIGHVHLKVADLERALSAGGCHHHIGRARRCAASPGRGAGTAGRSIRPRVSEALHLADPDGNGIDPCRDRPRDQWPQPQQGEKVHMYTQPLDVEALLAEAVEA